ncbi:hypothetical protein [Sorangium sp. So ce341]|uniref:hypothetical protein n=1 Tax=Sorangium sp. So ce341 TaxID=3133302 RepID=UPI003F6120A0
MADVHGAGAHRLEQRRPGRELDPLGAGVLRLERLLQAVGAVLEEIRRADLLVAEADEAGLAPVLRRRRTGGIGRDRGARLTAAAVAAEQGARQRSRAARSGSS